MRGISRLAEVILAVQAGNCYIVSYLVSLFISLAGNFTDGRQTFVSKTETTNVLSDVLHENEYRNRLYCAENGFFVCFYSTSLSIAQTVRRRMLVRVVNVERVGVQEREISTKSAKEYNRQPGQDSKLALLKQVPALRLGPTCFVGILLLYMTRNMQVQ